MEFLKRNVWWLFLLVCTLLFTTCAVLVAPPADFPSDKTLVIARGTSVADIAQELSDTHVIKHPSILRFFLRATGASARVQAGTYLFDAKESLLTVAHRLVTGAYGLPPFHMTFPEGVTVRDISEIASTALPSVAAQDILTLGNSQEGYLFPDTYLFSADVTPEAILKTMRVNFETKMSALSPEILTSGHPLSEIVTVASLVEKEARTDENRRIVAGILWDRLALGMPLQVDAVFGYIFNRDTYSPSLTDLKVDSPYNTYTHKGLPPGPICNPGLESIMASLHPTKTNYLYYLSDKEGVMHYATTYAAHQANQRKYLH